MHVVILAGGDPVDATALGGPAEADLVIAADSGLSQAAAVGLAVDMVVGDLDSAPPELVTAAERAGALVERHPEDKDATDLELALGRAVDKGATSVLVLGGGGGRIDHLLANALLLADRRWSAVRLEWRLGAVSLHVVHDSLTLTGTRGDLVTVLPLGGDALGVRLSGTRWPLEGAVLPAGTTRGVSNELAAPRAQISLENGVLLVIHHRRSP